MSSGSWARRAVSDTTPLGSAQDGGSSSSSRSASGGGVAGLDGDNVRAGGACPDRGASLADPGCGRTLATKLGLFVLVMLAAAGHGIAHAKGRAELARALAVVSLMGSLGVVLLATALPAT
ncbi:hypothetical protein [Streptomyces regalis]|uniref:hypothetical protein n=1 Tax=Streptomyces regalis TaxID=68262 RepID=UPI000AAB5219|nr:hypothetical protein [Streptomyces regalis]